MIREDRICIPFAYAAGEIASAFFVALRDEMRILGSRCDACARVVCPPRASCVACGGSSVALVQVGPRGTLKSWTEVPGRGVFGLVLLDGADTPILHRVAANADDLKAGMRVVPKFMDARKGHIEDLMGFMVDLGSLEEAR